jgi:hypothetical protein
MTEEHNWTRRELILVQLSDEQMEEFVPSLMGQN